MRFLKICFLAFGVLLATSFGVLAQTPTLAQTGAEQQKEVDYAAINKTLVEMQASMQSDKYTTNLTSDYIKRLDEMQMRISSEKSTLEQNLEFVQKRIDALGPVPTDGTKEPVELQKNRKEFNLEGAVLKSKIAEADIALAKIDELDAAILNIRNNALLSNISYRTTPLFYPRYFWQASAELGKFLFAITKSPYSWYQSLDTKDQENVRNETLPAAMIMVAALVVGIILSVFIRRKFGYQEDVEMPDYGTKVLAAIAVSIAYGVIPMAIIGAFLLWLYATPVLNVGLFGVILLKGAWYLLYIFLFEAIVRVVFVPKNGKWRLIDVCDKKARNMNYALFLSIILICVGGFFESVAIAGDFSEIVREFIKMIMVGIKTLCIIVVTWRFLCAADDCCSEETAVAADTNVEDGPVSLSTKVTLLLSFAAFVVFGVALFGYINLATFILDRFILSVLVVGFFYIFSRAIRGIVSRVFQFRFWVTSLKIGRKVMSRTGIIFDLIVNLSLIVFLIFVLLGLWGVSIDILLRNIRRILTEFTIGGVTISISSLLFGIAVFIVSAMLIKAIQKYLLNTALTSMEMEEGLKTSVISGFGFFGYIAAGIFAIGVMGGSLKNLAIIAGALSFGVGLGLQGIVNNFVSGLVLVFERPIKVGDWVIINGQEGIVKKINLRATELEMWTKASVIIPNSQILSSSLINMTHNNRQGRVDVKVGVAYGTDIQKVKTILLEIAKNHTLVLNVPNPYVVFNEFGDSSLDFELRCYTSNIGNRLSITNDLRAAILQRFTEESIEIPFPQRVVHTQSQNTIFLDKMVEGSAGTNKKAKLFAKKNAQKKKR